MRECTRGPPRRRTSEPRPPPQRKRPAGRLWRLRCLGSRRGSRQAHLLRPLRAAAPRPGVGGHRHLRRPAAPRLQGHGPRLPGLRRDRAERRCRGTSPSGTRATRPPAAAPGRTRSRRSAPTAARHGRPGAQRQPHQHRRARRPRRRALRRAQRRGELARGNTTDTALITALLAGDPDRTLEATALEVLPRLRGAFSLVFMDEHTLYAARDPQGVRPLVARPPRARLGRRQRDRRRSTSSAPSFVREIEPGEFIAIDADGLRTHRFADGRAARAASSSTSTWPGPTPRSPAARARRARRDGPPARRASTPSRPTWSSRSPSPARRRPSATPQAVGHPVRPGPDQERLRRAHVHPAVADPAPAGHPAQAQPAPRRHPRQAPRRRRRLDRPRQHPARPDPDAARGRRRRGARAHQLAAREVAVLLRHRLRLPRRAHRQRPLGRRDRAPRSAPTPSATSPRRA